MYRVVWRLIWQGKQCIQINLIMHSWCSLISLKEIKKILLPSSDLDGEMNKECGWALYQHKTQPRMNGRLVVRYEPQHDDRRPFETCIGMSKAMVTSWWCACWGSFVTPTYRAKTCICILQTFPAEYGKTSP